MKNKPKPITSFTLDEARDYMSHIHKFDRLLMNQDDIPELVESAKAALEHSYSPYSNFRVGAAVVAMNQAGDPKIFTGTNIENAAYSPTNCGERVAIQTAIAAGCTNIIAVAVVGDSPPGQITGPCGTCRQVIFEHGGGDCNILMIDSNDLITVVDANMLLPFAFGPSNLESVEAEH